MNTLKKYKLILSFVLLPIALTILGEFLLKLTINSLNLSANLSSAVVLFTNIPVLVSIFLIVLGGILWIIALSKFELSFIYPFLSINYVAIILGSQWFLGESVTIKRYLAMILIVIALVLISRSQYASSKEDSKT